MEKSLKKRLHVLVCAMLCCLLAHAQNQMLKLSGFVTDNNNQPLAGVTVKVQKASLVTTTAYDGSFKLEGLAPQHAYVEFSYIGFHKQVVAYTGQKELRVSMKEDANLLQGVEVSAKTNINAIDLRAKSGDVAEVDMRRLNEKSMIDFGLSLQGAVPGLTVISTGELGSAPEIRIRGNSSLRKGNTTNEPLYVLDGQVISAETFYNLNPTDISGIKVLKDAAACALYGTKAANGVIEVTSKRGIDGPMQLTANVEVGVTTKGRRGVRMMDSAEKLELERLLHATNAPGYLYSEDYYRANYADDPNLEQMIADGKTRLAQLAATHTDWFDELVKNNWYQKYNLSLRGGSDQTSYYASASFSKQGGRIEGNDKMRSGMRLNLDQKIGHIGYAYLSVDGAYTRTRTPNGSSHDPLRLVYELNPYETRDDRTLWSYPGQSLSDLLHEYQQKGEDKSAGVSGSLQLTPLPGLDVAASAGLDYLIDETEQFTPGSAYSQTSRGIPSEARGIYAKSKNTTTNVTTNVRVTYNHVFAGVHDLTLGANMDYYLTKLDNVGITGYGVGDQNSAAAINQSLTGSYAPKVSGLKDKNAQLGFGAVLGYTYDNTYDLYATYKDDGSSLLPSDKRWSSAWAVGLGWTPTQYGFLSDNKVLTRLRLKGTYGCTANLNGVSTSTTVATFQYLTRRYEDSRVLSLITLPNADLVPEKTYTTDFGLSMDLFSRITLEATWYKRRTEDALLDVPIPSSNGFTTLKRNIGVLDNSGIELSASVRVIDTSDWQLRLQASMAYNRNKVVDLYYADKIYSSSESLVPDYEVGKSYDMLYGPESMGINPLTGYPVFRSSDGTVKQANEVLTASDMKALGHLTPPYTGSINLSLSYKAFDLDADFYYVHGGVQAYNYSYVRSRDNANYNAVSGQVSDMWFKAGDENKTYPNPFNTSTQADNNMTLYTNSRQVGKSDYLRLSMLSLRYKVPYRFLQRHFPVFKYATFALQGSNLLTWTSYKESDPESGTLAGTTQPVITFSMNVTF